MQTDLADSHRGRGLPLPKEDWTSRAEVKGEGLPGCALSRHASSSLSEKLAVRTGATGPELQAAVNAPKQCSVTGQEDVSMKQISE